MIHVKPSIFIGLGGSGALVLQKVKYALAKRFSNDGQTVPACFRFLEVDIDTTSAPPLDQGGDCLGFDIAAGSEILVTSLGDDFNQLEKRIQNDAGQGYQAVSTWWPKGLGPKLHKVMASEKGDQAYQMRQVGRASFWLNNLGRNSFRRRVESAVKSITDNVTLATVTSQHPELAVSAAGGINVFVVSSVAGGTGCGMLIDGLANIRDVIGAGARIHTLLLMPSVYDERLKDEKSRQATRVNAYAALKELDQFMRTEDDFEYKELYSKDCVVNFNNRLSSLTYLLGNVAEDGSNFGGEGNRVASKTAQFITHMILGLASAEDKAKGVLDLVAGEVKLARHDDCHPVAKAYSSMGLYDFYYPQDRLASYAKNFAIQVMMAKVIEQPSGDVLKKIKSIIHGGGDTDIWQDELIPAIPDCQTSFSQATPDQFSAIKRKDVLNTVFSRYNESKGKIDRHYKNLENTLANASDAATIWILEKAKELLLDPAYSLRGSIEFLKEIEKDVQTFISAHRDEADRENESILDTAAIQKLRTEYSDTQNWALWGTANREQRLATLLPKLRGDLSSRGEAHGFSLMAKIAGRILERAIKPLRQKLDALETDMRNELGMARNRVQNEGRSLAHLLMTGECFGCSENDIIEIEETVTREAANQDSALRRSVMSDFIWNSKIAGPIADTLVNNTHGDVHFLERLKVCVDDNISDYLAAQARRASPMCKYRGGAHHNSAIYYMISRFSDQEIARYTDGNKIPGVDLIRMGHMEPNKVTFIAVRHGVPAAHIDEVVECFKMYSAHDGIPDTQYGVTAHLMRGAEDWPELIYEPKQGIDVQDYIRVCRKLGLLKKDEKGQYYTLFLGDAEDQAPRFNGLENVKKALANGEGLAAKVQKAIVTKLCEKFAANSTGFLSWSPANKVPEEIDKEVKKRLSLT